MDFLEDFIGVMEPDFIAIHWHRCSSLEYRHIVLREQRQADSTKRHSYAVHSARSQTDGPQTGSVRAEMVT